MTRSLDAQIRDCDPGTLVSRGEIDIFMQGVEFCCRLLIAAAQDVAQDVRGASQSKTADGKAENTVANAIIRSGQPAFAEALIRVAESMYTAGQNHARRLYPDFAQPALYSELQKSKKIFQND